MDNLLNFLTAISLEGMIVYPIAKYIILDSRKKSGQLDKPWWLC